MSFAIEWHANVRRAFSRFDIPVQEAILDEVERLADGGDLLPNRPLPMAAERDLLVETAGGAHYVFARVEYDAPRRTLVVARLGHFSRAAEA